MVFNRKSNSFAHRDPGVLDVTFGLARHTRAFFVALGIAVAGLLAGGCSLSEYEQKMLTQQQRVEYIDKENHYVGDPIAPPPKRAGMMAEMTDKGGDHQATAPGSDFDVFLRLPLGLSTKYEDIPEAGFLYRYKTVGSPFSEVLIATTTAQIRDDFWKDIIEHWGTYDPSTIRKESKDRLGRTLEFETWGITEGRENAQTTYYVYVYQAPVAEKMGIIAIIFAIPQSQANNSDALTAMDLSLRTLVIGPEAGQARQMYRPPTKR
jgi:hypothetical protein